MHRINATCSIPANAHASFAKSMDWLPGNALRCRHVQDDVLQIMYWKSCINIHIKSGRVAVAQRVFSLACRAGANNFNAYLVPYGS